MRIFHELIFDEFIADTAFHFTTFRWLPVTGNFETMKVVVIVDCVSGTSPSFALVLQETPDISLYLNSVTTLVDWTALVPGQSNTFTGSVSEPDGLPVSYAYNFVCVLGGTAPSAHVRIWVTGRGKA